MIFVLILKEIKSFRRFYKVNQFEFKYIPAIEHKYDPVTMHVMLASVNPLSHQLVWVSLLHQ